MSGDESTLNAKPLAPGLYLVATPIGNLGDITLRALDILRRAHRIACEDTRQTQKLLNHFQIATPTVSCHQHNEHARAAELIGDMKAGKAVALVSDAGTPGISDPGAWLVPAAIASGIPVIPIPGANAALSALIASGLSTADFRFLGFLPEKSGPRRTFLEDLAADFAANPRSTPQTFLFHEAPHRIADTLLDIEKIFGAQPHAVVVARELTKLHEEFLRGTAAEILSALASRDRIRGEFTLLLELQPAKSASDADGHTSDSHEASPKPEKISAQLARLKAEEDLDEKEALKRLARLSGQSKSELYRELQRERARHK
ncbi:MAG TPA: 16S rRNA (cytidine(1402)-2'-O)-methyltransferase [Terracidiphilus sp.]|nr:16S rRNA (cytidine(1402)-2'-O)-methyltransferase [Terracidiphilus sp.]